MRKLAELEAYLTAVHARQKFADELVAAAPQLLAVVRAARVTLEHLKRLDCSIHAEACAYEFGGKFEECTCWVSCIAAPLSALDEIP